MKSVKEAIDIIGENKFVNVKKILSPSDFNNFINAVRSERKTTFRINTLKTDVQSVLQKLMHLKIKSVKYELLNNGYIVTDDNGKNILNSEPAKTGLIYLQSISSQIPPEILDPQPGELILDMAAAPGSKTSQIAALMNNTGKIDAVEPDFVRKERLDFNLKLLGVTNVTTYQETGERFAGDKENYYDRVLLDAPCSGEGRFNVYDKSSYGAYQPDKILKFHNLQYKLLNSALKAVKIGGTVVYSTCTINMLENELVLDRIYKDNKFGIKIIKVDPKFFKSPEFVQPILIHDGERLNENIKGALRVVPSTKIEGFFICKIIKTS